MDVNDLEEILSKAADIEKRIPDKTLSMMMARSGWPEYLYDIEDRKHWMDKGMRIKRIVTSQEQSFYDKTYPLLNVLGMEKNKRTVAGKKIIWSKAHGNSDRKTSFLVGLSPPTIKCWYEIDIAFLARSL